MSRVCEVTGKKVMYGNNVSHAHNKTRRRFDINLQKKTFWVETLNKKVTLKVSAKGLKIIDKGLDELISVLNDDDIIIITGDHGTDPTDGKTDHSREYVPFIIYKNNLKPKYIGEGDTFSDIAATISDIYEIENIFPGKSSANHLS